ncbi:MAG: serine/threonine-protein kinase, partial [Planctomycetota bacterium]
QVIARFETEREALALMNHPNVARVFDAGATDDGRPYFAMEHVPGLRITDFCDMHRLTTDERLRLFADVCNAVQHAHQKGIIHRDMKPSNVLVAVQDDKPVVKVIDFGVAKATQQRLTEHTLFTEQGQLIGTPGYMSPEQAEMTALDIDTRTDIYSLGVLLYELLVGARPFDEKVLRQAGLAEIQRIIREVDPPKPSTKFSSLGVDSTVVAQKRRTEPRILARELRGDLDWVVMKCLEKDRTRRYETANALALEVQRHLQHDPVMAGPPARIYRLRKFLRKNRGPVGAVVIVFVVLTAGLFASSWSYLRAERQRQRADTEALTSARIKDFLVGLFKVSSPDEALGRAITAREILDRGSGRIRAELTDQPLVQAMLADTIGTVYANLGLYDTAERLLQEVLSLRQRNLPELHVDTAATLDHLGGVLYARGKYAEAERVHREALAMRQQLVGREHAVTAESLAHLASAVFALDRRSEADELCNEALAIRRKVLGPDDPALAASLLDLARLSHARDDVEDAERLYREALDIHTRALGRMHPDSVETMHGLAGLLYRKG